MATVDFLEGQLKIRNVIFLPFPIMLIPMVIFYSLIPKPNSAQIQQMRKWFWQCTLLLRYKAGTNRHVLEDIRKFHKVADGERPFDRDYEVSSELFKSSWRINSTSAKAALCLMAQLRPKSFLTGNEVDLGKVLSSYNAREFHHIYPKGYLKNIGFNFHDANKIANICFLTASDNNTISDEAPEEYFKRIPEERREVIFNSAIIPNNAREGKRFRSPRGCSVLL